MENPDYNPDDPNAQSNQPPQSAAALYPSIVQAYQALLGRTPSDAEIMTHVVNGQPDPNLWQNIASSPEALQYQQSKNTPAPATTPAPTPAATPPPSGAGDQTPPDIFNAPLTKPYGGVFTPPAPVNLGGPAGIPYIPPTPTFTGANAPPTFTAPSVADALNDPGYQFRVGQGDQGLQNWAAAKGTLNDSSTAKALEDYNQNAASQEYSDVFNRALQGYGTQENNWMNTVLNPTMLAYSTQASAGQHQNDVNYQNAWQQFLDAENQYYNWQNNTWSKLYQAAQ